MNLKDLLGSNAPETDASGGPEAPRLSVVPASDQPTHEQATSDEVSPELHDEPAADSLPQHDPIETEPEAETGIVDGSTVADAASPSLSDDSAVDVTAGQSPQAPEAVTSHGQGAAPQPSGKTAPRARRSRARATTPPSDTGAGLYLDNGALERGPRAPEAPMAAPRVRPNRLSWQERKEVFMWPSQFELLRDLEYRLNRVRPRGKGDRITMNTLVRVALDLLESHADELTGMDENELLASLGLPNRNYKGEVVSPTD